MLADIAKKLPSQSLAKLVNMLGPPLDTPYFKSADRDLIYITAPKRDSLLGIDSERLLIWMDEEEVHKRHYIVTD